MDVHVRLRHLCDVVKYLIVATGLNVLLLLTPVAWWAHFDGRLSYSAVFTRMFFCRIIHQEHSFFHVVCFLSIIPHECLFDYCGEQMALYCGKDFGDLITITLNK